MHINFYLNEKNIRLCWNIWKIWIYVRKREVKWTIFNRNVVIFFYNYQINLKVTTLHFL